MKNAMQLKAVIKNISKDKHISAQLVMQNFMLERLLERISVSKYHQNFILKGGFLIAAMVGLDTRATMDMDVTSEKRGSLEVLKDYKNIMDTVRNSDVMIKQWRTYQKDFEYAADINFDDDKFYRKEFNILSGSKGVDIIASSDKFIHMIEIKNCKGKEQGNIWRIGVNNKNIKKRVYNDSDRFVKPMVSQRESAEVIEFI